MKDANISSDYKHFLKNDIDSFIHPNFGDITCKKSFVHAINDSNNIWLNILDSLPVVIFINDDERCLWANRHTQTILGIKSEKLQKLNKNEIYSLFNEEDILKTRNQGLNAFVDSDKRKNFSSAEYRLKINENEWKWVNIHFSRLDIDSENSLSFIIGAAFDIDERVKNEESLKRLNVELESNFKLLEWKNKLLNRELNDKKNMIIQMTLNLAEKNHTFIKLKEKLLKIASKEHLSKTEIEILANSLDTRVESERTWQVFEAQFEVIHPNYYNNLLKKYPQLTITELKICMMLKFDLKTKDIAAILNISPRTAEHHRQNIRNKFNLDSKEQLTVFLQNSL